MKKEKEELNNSDLTVIIKKTKKILNLLYFVIVCGLILTITFLIKSWGILTFIGSILKVMAPLFIGFIIAWLLEPMVKRLNHFGIKRGLAAIIVVLIFISLIFLFFSFLIPTLYDQLNDLITSFPSILSGFEKFIHNMFSSLGSIQLLDTEKMQVNLFAQIQGWIVSFTTNLPNILLKIITSFFTKLGTFIIGLMVGLYMLIDFESIKEQLMIIVPKKFKLEIDKLIQKIAIELRKYVNGTLFVAMLILIVCSISFAIVGLKAPLLFGVFCGITDLIPYIGPYIGGTAAAVVGFSQSSLVGFSTMVIIFVVQAIESMVIQPLIMGKTMKLHPVMIILGLLVFGHFFGIIGMVLATPALALIKTIYQFFAEKYDWFGKNY